MTDSTVHGLKSLSTLFVCNHARRTAPACVLRELHETQYRAFLRAHDSQLPVSPEASDG